MRIDKFQSLKRDKNAVLQTFRLKTKAICQLKAKRSQIMTDVDDQYNPVFL